MKKYLTEKTFFKIANAVIFILFYKFTGFEPIVILLLTLILSELQYEK